MTDENLLLAAESLAESVPIESVNDAESDGKKMSAHERAIHLLDREVPEEYRREWTARVAAPVEAISSGTASVVIFRLGREWLALSATVFQEVAEPSVVHAVPHRRSGNLRGLVNVRGELILCVALGAALELEATVQAEAHAAQQRLLVINKMGQRLAFPVDVVLGVTRYHPRELLDVPATLSQTTATYITALLPWNDKSVGILDLQTLFDTLNRSFS